MTFADLPAGSTPQGLAFDAGGNLFVADSSNSVILEVTPGGVVTTFFAEFHGVVMPEGLAFDANGNLFIADAGFGTIVKLTPDGTLSTVVPASAGLSVPTGIAFDGNGTLYVANSPGGALPPGIAAVSPSGAVTMFVQGLPALGSPVGLVFQRDHPSGSPVLRCCPLPACQRPYSGRTRDRCRSVVPWRRPSPSGRRVGSCNARFRSLLSVHVSSGPTVR